MMCAVLENRRGGDRKKSSTARFRCPPTRHAVISTPSTILSPSAGRTCNSDISKRVRPTGTEGSRFLYGKKLPEQLLGGKGDLQLVAGKTQHPESSGFEEMSSTSNSSRPESQPFPRESLHEYVAPSMITA